MKITVYYQETMPTYQLLKSETIPNINNYYVENNTLTIFLFNRTSIVYSLFNILKFEVEP